MPGFRHVVRCAQCGHLGGGRHRVQQSMHEVRDRAPLVRAMRVVRPRQPIRVHAADPGAGLSQERPQRVHVFLAANDRRARNDDAAQQRCAKSVRRSVQVLNATSSRDSDTWVSLRTRSTRRPRASREDPAARHAAAVHANDWRARDRVDRAPGAGRARQPQRSHSRRGGQFRPRTDRAAQYGIERIPAIVLLSGEKTRGCASLARQLATSSCRSSRRSSSPARTIPADAGSRALIAANVTAPLDIQVFVTPT